MSPSPPVHVLGDRRQLVSAMHSLLENAVTFSYEDAAVTVSGGRADGEVRLSVTDSAWASPHATSTASSSASTGSTTAAAATPAGTGLGLSIVRHVASNHQGRVEVDSARARARRSP